MKKQIRVLMLVPNLRVSNGVASYAMGYYRKLDHKKVRMDFVCYRNLESPYVQEIEEQGDHIFFLPPVKKIGEHFKYCKKIILEGNYDVIHDNSLMITYPIMLVAKRLIRVRILHSHNTKMGDTRKKEIRNSTFKPLLLHTCNYFSACSSLAGKALFGKRKFKIIPNVIDPQAFRFNEDIRNQKRAEEGCTNKIVIGAVGRLAHQKNPYFAIDVIEKVVESRDDIVFWWIGSGGLDQDIKRYVDEKGLEGKIKLLGSRSDVTELYQAMDLFFLPSRFEGFGLACLEAEAAGLPCVVSTEFPSEINVTGAVKQISLDKNLDVWAIEISNALRKKADREEGFAKVNGSVYSNKVSGSKLTEFYLELIAHSCGEDK